MGHFHLLLVLVCNLESTCQYTFPLFVKTTAVGPFLWLSQHTDFLRGHLSEAGGLNATCMPTCIIGQLKCLSKPGLSKKEQLRIAALFIMNSEFSFFFPFISEQIIHVLLTQHRIYGCDLVGTSYLLLSQARCQKSGMQPPLTLHGHSLYLSPFLH